MYSILSRAIEKNSLFHCAIAIPTTPLTSMARSQGSKIYHALQVVEQMKADGAFLRVCYGSSSEKYGGCLYMPWRKHVFVPLS